MKNETAKLAFLSFKSKAIPDHPSHEAHHTQRNKYAEAIKQTKRDHWFNWLENISSEEIWIANKYLNSDPSDGSPSRIPTLNLKNIDGSTTIAM